MLDRILPKQIDNRFRGLRLALWPFGLLIAMKLMIGTNSMLNTYSVATGADGIALDSFPAAASREILQMFALLGLGQFVMGLFGLIVLVRYRAQVPLFLCLLLLERAVRFLLIAPDQAAPAMPIAGQIVTLLVPTLIGIALVLSLWPGDRSNAAS